ncbi:hypothetical protein [Acetivibrio mesophilus]|uniref:Uncharacterized protein n=1 Tax=Acetivibrio mesophilus TaxID=2487273 RepID=A0A4Q0I1J9_9FIRM|nr:hypothetical protein [Acetivibrio mesophilus]ODM26158.1 hypothetical protein A7W90_07915 [Clostridium sp. Bc-iso-3]RXE57515.1 hypothetical protein EFD62_17320 [Acetivibrio mesophilus]
MKNKILPIILLMIILSLTVACGTSEFDENYQRFKESYIIATEFVENDGDSLENLKEMDLDLFESELKKMKEAMDSMRPLADSKYKEGVYSNVENYYERLEFLLYAYKNMENLTVKQKGRVYSVMYLVSQSRENIKNGEK